MLANIMRAWRWRKWCKKYGFVPLRDDWAPMSWAFLDAVERHDGIELFVHNGEYGEHTVHFFNLSRGQHYAFPLPESEGEFFAMLI